MRNGIARLEARSLFISDVHLGSRYCQPRPLRELLRVCEPERIYIVGDFCDGWLLRRRWVWHPEYAALVDALRRLSERGTQVRYLLGNHDRCLHRWVSDWGDFWIGEKCVHRAADGRRLLVIHGDQFDGTQTRFRRAASFSALLHEQVLGGSHIANRWLAELGVRQRRLASALTQPIKAFAHSVGQMRLQLKQFALENACDGVLYGHTHAPHIRESDGFLFANTGDWLEHCSAILETPSGQFELWMSTGSGWLQNCRRVALSPASYLEVASNEIVAMR